jgi:tRNA wybutosine-synthesizing protein 4
MESDFGFKVEDTSQEAMSSKISAINKGYYSDKYAKIFFSSSSKKEVLMNRGYWSRYEAFRMMISKFLDSESLLLINF